MSLLVKDVMSCNVLTIDSRALERALTLTFALVLFV